MKGAPNCVVASPIANGEPKFPLSWIYAPFAVMGYEIDKMTKYEQGVVRFLEKMLLSDIHKLLDKEGDADDLDAYLRECFVVLVWPVFILDMFLFSDVVLFVVDPMKPLTPAERNLYLAELKAKKAVDGYVTSDPAGMMHRTGRRKDASSKGENAVINTKVVMDQVGVAEDGKAVETAKFPKKKKARTRRAESTRVRLTGVFVKEKTAEATSSLNEKVVEFFWHKDFDFRRYGFYCFGKPCRRRLFYLVMLICLCLVGTWKRMFLW